MGMPAQHSDAKSGRKSTKMCILIIVLHQWFWFFWKLSLRGAVTVACQIGLDLNKLISLFPLSSHCLKWKSLLSCINSCILFWCDYSEPQSPWLFDYIGIWRAAAGRSEKTFFFTQHKANIQFLQYHLGFHSHFPFILFPFLCRSHGFKPCRLTACVLWSSEAMQILAYTELQAWIGSCMRMGKHGNANWSETLPGPLQTITDHFLKQCSPDCAASEQNFLQSSEHNEQNCHIWAWTPPVSRRKMLI